MLKGVSWKSYLSFVLVILVLYYVTVVIIYFRKEIISFIRNGFKVPVEASRMKPPPDTGANKDVPDENALLPAVHELMAELNTLFDRAAAKKYVYRELVLSLQKQLKNYSAIRNSSFQSAINDHIIQQSREQCFITIDDSDIQQIWP